MDEEARKAREAAEQDQDLEDCAYGVGEIILGLHQDGYEVQVSINASKFGSKFSFHPEEKSFGWTLPATGDED